MKFRVVIDPTGEIVAAQYPRRHPAPKGRHRVTSSLTPGPGQSLHDVAMPPALLAHLEKETFEHELFAHRLELHPEGPRLVRRHP